jgi:hypothetical protein
VRSVIVLGSVTWHGAVLASDRGAGGSPEVALESPRPWSTSSSSQSSSPSSRSRCGSCRGTPKERGGSRRRSTSPSGCSLFGGSWRAPERHRTGAAPSTPVRQPPRSRPRSQLRKRPPRRADSRPRSQHRKTPRPSRPSRPDSSSHAARSRHIRCRPADRCRGPFRGSDSRATRRNDAARGYGRQASWPSSAGLRPSSVSASSRS